VTTDETSTGLASTAHGAHATAHSDTLRMTR